jgi:hypothetical protein
VNGRRASRSPIGSRPAADPAAQAWIQQQGTSAAGKAQLYTARLTIDVTPALRGRIKVIAFERGVTVADMLRVLLEREFDDKGPAA